MPREKAQYVALGFKLGLSFFHIHFDVQLRHSFDAALLDIAFISELMNNDVVAFALYLRLDIIPGEDDRTALPGFADQLASTDMHRTVLILVLVLDDEAGWVEHHGIPAAIIIEPEVEDRQTRLQCECEPHGRHHLQSAHRFDRLGPQETLAELEKPCALGCIQSREQG